MSQDQKARSHTVENFMTAKFIEAYNNYTINDGKRNNQLFSGFVKTTMEAKRKEAKEEFEKKMIEAKAKEEAEEQAKKEASSRRSWGFWGL